MRLRLALGLLLGLALPAPAAANPYFVHCYDFGCKSRQEVRFDAEQWSRVRALFTPAPADAAAERQTIRRAIALLERISGKIAGTASDRAGNAHDDALPRQQDCIDESTNTFQYLVALEGLGLLRWHAAGLKHRRIVWLATHWTATVVERANGKRFAVDSWYRDNGELPMLQPLDDWRRKRDWPVELNPELAARRS